MRKVDFLATDGIKLNGILYESKENTTKIVLSIHGMSSNCLKKREDIFSNYMNKNKIDYFCFNNRGSELIKYIRKNINDQEEKLLGGTSYEDVLEGYEDIVGAILKLKELGYKEIYLQGHSLGCTKIVYTYNELKEEGENNILNCIKGIILLSLIDIPNTLKTYLGNNYESYIKLAEEKEQEGKIHDLMPKEAFIHPISVKTFLRYAKYNKEIDFARYGRDDKLEKLNNIDVPLFMRWGNENEMIIQKAEELVLLVNNLITNDKKDIDYIEGSNHSYNGKEQIVANQMIRFINK